MMPVTAAGYFDLDHAEIPKASTVMNIVRLIGGTVATATFAVILERQIIARPRSDGGQGRRQRRRHLVVGQASARRRRPGGGGIRPHVLVGGRDHPPCLHPDARSSPTTLQQGRRPVQTMGAAPSTETAGPSDAAGSGEDVTGAMVD